MTTSPEMNSSMRLQPPTWVRTTVDVLGLVVTIVSIAVAVTAVVRIVNPTSCFIGCPGSTRPPEAQWLLLITAVGLFALGVSILSIAATSLERHGSVVVLRGLLWRTRRVDVEKIVTIKKGDLGPDFVLIDGQVVHGQFILDSRDRKSRPLTVDVEASWALAILADARVARRLTPNDKATTIPTTDGASD